MKLNTTSNVVFFLESFLFRKAFLYLYFHFPTMVELEEGEGLAENSGLKGTVMSHLSHSVVLGWHFSMSVDYFFTYITNNISLR